MNEATRPGVSAPTDGNAPDELPLPALSRRPGRWVDVRSGTPPPGEDHRVIVYTEGYDFAGEQFFHIDADALSDFADPESVQTRDREVAEHASHWIYEHDLRMLIAQQDAQPVKAYELRFPAMLRRMWSGGEVQAWLNALPQLFAIPEAAIAASVDGLRKFSQQFDERNVDATGDWRAAVEDMRNWLDDLLAATAPVAENATSDDVHEREHLNDPHGRADIYAPGAGAPSKRSGPNDAEWDRSRLDAALDDFGRVTARMTPAAAGGTVDQKIDLARERERIHRIVASMGAVQGQVSAVDYLASPYSHPDPVVLESRRVAVCRKAGELIAAGDAVISPIAHNVAVIREIGGTTGWDVWKGVDLALLSVCRKLLVLRLPGWDKSEGIAGEIAAAVAMGKPVEYIDP